MKNFAIFHNNREKDRCPELHDVILSNFDHISSEYDNGLFFIRSGATAGEIREVIEDLFSMDMSDICYVMELGSDLSANGNSKTMRAIEDAL